MKKVSVDLNKESFYIEKDSFFHRFKRSLTYKHPLKLIKKYTQHNNRLSALEIGVGSGYFLHFFKHAFPDSSEIHCNFLIKDLEG